MKNILILCPVGASPVQIYRGIGVLEQLRRIDPEINIVHPLHNDPWENLIHVDLVYAMRQSSPRDLAFLKAAKSMGVPVWYDADDDYFNVTPDSPVFAAYQNGSVRQSIIQFLTEADFVTVSTNDLKAKFKVFRNGKPIEVVNNALDDYIFKDWDTFPTQEAKKVIVWRGGATHQADLGSFADQFWQFFDATKNDWKAQFIGFYPLVIQEGHDWSPKDYSSRIVVNEYDSRYYHWVRNLRAEVKPWAVVVPLRDNPFNRAKSNIAALEAIYAGAVPIVPDWEEWQFPGAFKYSKREDAGKLMAKVSRLSEGTRQDLWILNRNFMAENYLLSIVNPTRVGIVDFLIKGIRPAIFQGPGLVKS